MNSPISDFNLADAFLSWLAVVAFVVVLGFFAGWASASAARKGVLAGFRAAWGRACDLFRDLVGFSPRRFWAIAWHAVLESWRRRVLLVFCVFAVLFLFAGWYLPTRPTEQVRVYVSFVLMSSMLITMIAMTLLAAISLPGDIRHQTIHTVVTKPVRRLEIVVGRIAGFTMIATAMLLIMGVVSYLWLVRSVNASVAFLESRRQEAARQGNVQRQQKLQEAIDQIRSKRTAKVPAYGRLLFRNQKGELAEKNKSVGDETKYRSYIEGNTTEAAIWHFQNLPVRQLLAKGEIPVELMFTVFRTTTGIVGEGVVCQLIFRNPRTGFEIPDYPFEIREFYVNRVTLRDSPEEPEKSLARLLEGSGGELVIEARCLSPSQYLGMAPADLYIKLDDASFGLNFLKGMIGVWLRVFLIVCVAVTVSTFLSAPVAVLATIAVFIGGMSMDFLLKLAAGKSLGGGPTESAIRLVLQENLVRDLGNDFWVLVSKRVDQVFEALLTGITYVLPDLGMFNTAPSVANGFDVPVAQLLYMVLAAMAYAVPFTIFGYYLFQSREIAR